MESICCVYKVYSKSVKNAMTTDFGEHGLKNLPFKVGERIEVVIHRSHRQSDEEQYPFWGKTISYLNPTDPVAEADWGILQ